MEFIEAPLFTQLVSRYLADDEYRRLQLYLALDPDAGDIMPGTGGCRKMRWADQRRSKGKRGGLRLIYYHLVKDGQIWLLTLYTKGEVADLSARERRLLKVAIEDEVRQRAQRRRPKGR
ncbi:MAG TPA: toxin [Thermoanaerobaculia bacterium]|nr:toxin [Thermoanaerobaculia bacterium]